MNFLRDGENLNKFSREGLRKISKNVIAKVAAQQRNEAIS